MQVSVGVDWELRVHVLKRKGGVHDGVLRLPSIPRGLAPLITPTLAKPSVRHVGRGGIAQPQLRRGPCPEPLGPTDRALGRISSLAVATRQDPTIMTPAFERERRMRGFAGTSMQTTLYRASVPRAITSRSIANGCAPRAAPSAT